jgi:3-oxoacyl-[acyl-carrier protein] reductase
MARTLEGQVAIITGGTRGIGRATAEFFAAHGVKVFGRPADILDAGAMKQFVNDVAARFGRVDILVNNAGGSEQRQAAGSRQQVYAVDPIDGRTLPPGRFEEMGDDEFLNAFKQKVLALGFTMKAVLPIMKKQKSGSIINVVSMKGKQPPPRVVSSSVAAAAAMNLSKALSLEVAEFNIRVNVVALESIITSQTEKSRQRWAPDKSMDEFLAPRNANIPMHRLGTADEVAHAIYCLAAPLGAYITGQVLCVDGGGLRSW